MELWIIIREDVTDKKRYEFSRYYFLRIFRQFSFPQTNNGIKLVWFGMNLTNIYSVQMGIWLIVKDRIWEDTRSMTFGPKVFVFLKHFPHKWGNIYQNS